MGDPPAVPRPSKSLGWAAAGLAFFGLTCATLKLGPFLSLALSLYALSQIAQHPERHSGSGMAWLGILLSVIGIAYVVLMGPYFGPSGDMRFGGLLFRNGQSKERLGEAIGRIRTLISAEAAYSNDTAGAVATLECLQKPTTCTPPRPADPIYIEGNWPGATVNEDWVTRIHFGSPSAKGTIDRYAVTLLRKKPGRGDRNALCGDSTGALLYSTEAVEPRLKDGLCDPSLPPVP